MLAPSPFLSRLAPIASFHHERLDGSGYHRGVAAPGLTRAARVLAAADVYQAVTEPRPHRGALPREDAAALLGQEASAGRLDREAVRVVLEAAGEPVPPMQRPVGLTEREVEVVALVARGLLTKQIARALEISAKTADRHIQHAYRKMGVSTRASAALFAMEHGLVTWGEAP
ncbi:MAG: LuxR C-terminal-related transcriptional regulator [Actinomycetota bacterium]|nr:LuxR C-terminal-related transcriptional regulator [Actinomycetota bacterium]